MRKRISKLAFALVLLTGAFIGGFPREAAAFCDSYCLDQACTCVIHCFRLGGSCVCEDHCSIE